MPFKITLAGGLGICSRLPLMDAWNFFHGLSFPASLLRSILEPVIINSRKNKNKTPFLQYYAVTNYLDSFSQHKPVSNQLPFVVISIVFTLEMWNEARKRWWVLHSFRKGREWVQVPVQTTLITFNHVSFVPLSCYSQCPFYLFWGQWNNFQICICSIKNPSFSLAPKGAPGGCPMVSQEAKNTN